MVFLDLGTFTLMRTMEALKVTKYINTYILNTKLACYFGVFCLKEEPYLVGSLNIL